MRIVLSSERYTNLAQKELAISDEHVKNTCRQGPRELNCRYLVFSGNGWECAKDSVGLKQLLDYKVLSGSLTSKGDNCDGWAEIRKTKTTRVVG
jgi:hypothetical protein